MRRALMVLLVCACSGPAAPEAERWSPSQLIDEAEDGESYDGFHFDHWVTLEGHPAPFRGADFEAAPVNAKADGLAVLPAFAEGGPAAYLLSDAWLDHPDPWVQPFYQWVSEWNAASPFSKALEVPTTLGVGSGSNFYSPFYQAIYAVPKGEVPKDGAPDTRAVLQLAKETHPGPLILWPLVPDGFDLTGGLDPVRPLTLTPVKLPKLDRARIDGAWESFISFPPDRFEAYPNGLVDGTHVYFFAADDGADLTVLEDLPAVLAADAVESAFAHVVKVIVDKKSFVFVPAGAQWDGIRARLSQKVSVPDASAAIAPELAAAYALRVATNASCFGQATFPDGCVWLDSEAALLQKVPPRKRIDTRMTVTAAPVLYPVKLQ
jgi:hypothetical protein